MAGIGGARTVGLLLGAAALAACSGGGGGDGGTAALRARVESQASEIEALRKAAKDMDARARLLEERLSASRPSPAAAAAAAAKASPGSPAPDAADAPEAAPVPSPSTDAVAAFLDTEQGRQKLVEAVEAAEKRRAEKADQDQKERIMGFVKERVTGYLTEQLNLDAAQQQAVLTVAVDTTEKMTEVWRGMRDARGDAAALVQAREKSNEIRQQAMDKIQQSLTAEQITKFQEIMSDGGGGFLMGGGRGGPGGFGGGAPPAGGGRGAR